MGGIVTRGLPKTAAVAANWNNGLIVTFGGDIAFERNLQKGFVIHL
ncbi:hypothetical protein BGS_0760 [Beggiatoa sp. SS]|nr:hypothetical protein BGS_0760 [Beggiatoa sp. SS]